MIGELGSIQNFRGVRHIALQLLFQCVDPIEPLFRANELDELHPSLFTVKVAVKPNEMGFNERMLGVLIEGWTLPDIDRGGIASAVRPEVEGGIDRVCRHAHVSGHGDIRGGEPNGPSPLVALDHGAPQFVGPAEQTVRDGNLTPSKGTADCSRRDRFDLAIGPRKQCHPFDFEAMNRAELFKHLDVACSFGTEVEVASNNDRLGTKAANHDALDELRWRLGRTDFIERNHNCSIDTAPAQQFELEVEFGEQTRSVLGTEHHRRMWFKGNDRSLGIETRRYLLSRPNDRLVSAMYSVVHTNGEGMARF